VLALLADAVVAFVLVGAGASVCGDSQLLSATKTSKAWYARERVVVVQLTPGAIVGGDFRIEGALSAGGMAGAVVLAAIMSGLYRWGIRGLI